MLTTVKKKCEQSNWRIGKASRIQNRYSSLFNLIPTFLSEFFKEAKKTYYYKTPSTTHSGVAQLEGHVPLSSISHHLRKQPLLLWGEKCRQRWINGRAHERGGVAMWRPMIVGGVTDRGPCHWLKMGRVSPVMWPRKSMEREERAWVNKLSIRSNWLL